MGAAKIRNCGVVAFRIKKRYVPSKSKRHGRHITFEIAPNSITTLQFSLYDAPSTNHDKMRQKLEDEEDDILEESKESDVDNNEQQQCDVSLPQSVSEIVSPGILAYIKDDKMHYDDMLDINNQNERPKIPKKITTAYSTK